MRFAIRLAVGAAIGIAFLLARDFHGYSLPYSIASAVCAVGLAQATALIYDRHRKAGIAVAAVIACGAIGGSAAYSFHLHPGPIAFREVDVVMADPDRWLGDTVKLHGYLDAGSLHVRVDDRVTQYLFTMHVKDKRVAARMTGPVPDTFKDRAEVVATGRLVRERDGYLFEAVEILAKCPSTYQTASGPQPASAFR